MKLPTRKIGTQPEHNVTLYNQVREEEVPLNFTGDVHYMLHKNLLFQTLN